MNLRFLGFFVLTVLFAFPAIAQEAAPKVAEGQQGLVAIGAAIGVGIAALGGTLGQGRAASAALDGIARNPGATGKIFVPMILGLALIESLVVLTWVIANGLAGKIH
jgi:F-type H+-transporting ATPase subunit c